MAHEHPIGPYVIEERIATGGMAEVFVARKVGPHGFSKRVALKRILPQFAKDAAFVSMFIDEACLSARLSHPNVVGVYDFGEIDGAFFLVMELVDGSNVNRLLRAASARHREVPLDCVVHIAAQTAHALAYAHGLRDDGGRPLGFVHRDVSPANILLTRTGHVKLTDFGIAMVAERPRHTDEGHVRGKLGYMSPEQVVGKPLDARSDVFTLSTVVAELLLSEPLFGTGGELDVLIRIRDVDLSVLDRSARVLPEDVVRLLRAGLSQHPEGRPSARTLAAAFDEIARRRGMGNSPGRLASLGVELGLFRPESDGVGESDEPERPVSAPLDPRAGRGATAALLGQIGVRPPARYEVAGEEVALSLPELIDRAVRGELAEDVAIAKDEGEPAPARDLPELARFVGNPTYRFDPPDAARVRENGEILGAVLVSLVHRVGAERRTGMLFVSSGETRRKVYFVDGLVVNVVTSAPADRLGEALIAAGRCMRVDVELALTLLPRYGGRLGDALVGLGALRPHELFVATVEQVRRRLAATFAAPGGSYAWVPDETCDEELYPVCMTPAEVAREAALHLTDQALDVALGGLLGVPLRRVVVAGASDLGDGERRTLDFVDGARTAEAVVAVAVSEGEIGEGDARRALVLALCCGLVERA